MINLRIDGDDLNIKYPDGVSIWYRVKRHQDFDELNDILDSLGFELDRIEPYDEDSE